MSIRRIIELVVLVALVTWIWSIDSGNRERSPAPPADTMIVSVGDFVTPTIHSDRLSGEQIDVNASTSANGVVRVREDGRYEAVSPGEAILTLKLGETPIGRILVQVVGKET